MNNEKKLSNLNQIFSIDEICKMMNLSRCRFYQLIEQGIFPPPLYDLRSHRPFFTSELREKYLEIKNSKIGFNGDIILFYNPRCKPNKKSKKKEKLNPKITEIVDALNEMNLNTNYEEVLNSIKNLYPEGFEKEEIGLVIRDVFRFLKAK